MAISVENSTLVCLPGMRTSRCLIGKYLVDQRTTVNGPCSIVHC